MNNVFTGGVALFVGFIVIHFYSFYHPPKQRVEFFEKLLIIGVLLYIVIGFIPGKW